MFLHVGAELLVQGLSHPLHAPVDPVDLDLQADGSQNLFGLFRPSDNDSGKDEGWDNCSVHIQLGSW